MTSEERAALDGDPAAQQHIDRLLLQVVIDDRISPRTRWTVTEVGERVRRAYEARRASRQQERESA